MIRDGLTVVLPKPTCEVDCQGCKFYRKYEFLGTATREAARHIRETNHAVRISRGSSVLVNFSRLERDE